MSDIFTTITFADLPDYCFISPDNTRPAGEVAYPSDQTLSQIIENLTIETPMGNATKYHNIRVILCSSLTINIKLFSSNHRLQFGHNCSGFWKFHTWGEGSDVQIGNNVTSNGVDCFLNPNSTLTIGDDCMFAVCHIHVGDSHAIFDMQTQAILNSTENPRVTLHEHVWVGLMASILTDSEIGAGSIVASKAVVTGAFPPYTLLAGVPAKIKRLGVSWSRLHNGADRAEVTQYLNSLASS